MLALEAMFRFSSKEIKDQVLCNYDLKVARHGLIDKEDDKEREKRHNEAYDDNIVFGEEQAVFDVNEGDGQEEQVVVDKNQWTQK